MSRSQFQSKRFILRHAWLNLWDERMTTGRINQVAIIHCYMLQHDSKTYWRKAGMTQLPYWRWGNSSKSQRKWFPQIVNRKWYLHLEIAPPQLHIRCFTVTVTTIIVQLPIQTDPRKYHSIDANDSVECCAKESTQWYPLCIGYQKITSSINRK